MPSERWWELHRARMRIQMSHLDDLGSPALGYDMGLKTGVYDRLLHLYGNRSLQDLQAQGRLYYRTFRTEQRSTGRVLENYERVQCAVLLGRMRALRLSTRELRKVLG